MHLGASLIVTYGYDRSHNFTFIILRLFVPCPYIIIIIETLLTDNIAASLSCQLASFVLWTISLGTTIHKMDNVALLC